MIISPNAARRSRSAVLVRIRTITRMVIVQPARRGFTPDVPSFMRKKNDN